MVENRFQSSDTWIFMSLGDDEGGCTLKDLIAKADWINHAIPTEQEIEEAINHLMAAGLVIVKDDQFIRTESGREIFNAVAGKHRAIHTIWKKLDQYLNKIELPYLTVDEFSLKPNEKLKAYKAYNKEFWQAYAQLEKKDKKREEHS